MVRVLLIGSRLNSYLRFWATPIVPRNARGGSLFLAIGVSRKSLCLEMVQFMGTNYLRRAVVCLRRLRFQEMNLLCVRIVRNCNRIIFTGRVDRISRRATSQSMRIFSDNCAACRGGGCGIIPSLLSHWRVHI